MQNGHHTKDLQTVGVLAANECKEEQCELRSHPAGDWSGQYKQLFFLSNKNKKQNEKKHMEASKKDYLDFVLHGLM